jgi:hypothetical protein
VSTAASDYRGFGFAVAHEYIKDNFDEGAKQEVRTKRRSYINV